MSGCDLCTTHTRAHTSGVSMRGAKGRCPPPTDGLQNDTRQLWGFKQHQNQQRTPALGSLQRSPDLAGEEVLIAPPRELYPRRFGL